MDEVGANCLAIEADLSRDEDIETVVQRQSSISAVSMFWLTPPDTFLPEQSKPLQLKRGTLC